MKKCNRCEEVKNFSEFNKDKSKLDGYRYCCKNCHQQWAKLHPQKAKDLRLRKKFGISLNEYNQMYLDQNSVCALCGRASYSKHRSGKIKSLAVDHCHKTKKVRGLLCDQCNRGLGLFKDDATVLTKAIEYLRKFK